MTRHLLPMMKLIGILAVASGLVAATIGSLEGQTWRRLVREGKTSIGQVEGKRIVTRWWGDPTYKFLVKYEPRDGLVIEREFDVSWYTYFNCSYCEPPEVHYLPNDPEVAEIPIEGTRGLKAILGGGVASLLGLVLVGSSTWLRRSTGGRRRESHLTLPLIS